jgi:hypothetical protein
MGFDYTITDFKAQEGHSNDAWTERRSRRAASREEGDRTNTVQGGTTSLTLHQRVSLLRQAEAARFEIFHNRW